MDTVREYESGGCYIRHAVDESPDPSSVNFHVHDRCEIYCFVSGTAEYHVEGTVYPLGQGSLLIMRPGEAHCVRILDSTRYERYAVNFPLSLFDGFDPRRTLMAPFTERELGKDNHYILEGQERVFGEMLRDNVSDYERTVLITVRLIGLIDLIVREYRSSETSAGEYVTLPEKAVAYVNRHLFEKLSIEALASHFFLSRSQFGRIFKQATGASPWDYITAKRLIAAKSLISGGVPAGVAAENCGFGDYSSFYRAYVKRFKHSPGAKT